MDTMTVANTILEQLGGRRFMAMTGAKNFVGDAASLTFKLPSNFAKRKINLVKITLTPADLYDVAFYNYRGLTLTLIDQTAGVYAEDLQRIVSTETGLDLSI